MVSLKLSYAIVAWVMTNGNDRCLCLVQLWDVKIFDHTKGIPSKFKFLQFAKKVKDILVSLHVVEDSCTLFDPSIIFFWSFWQVLYEIFTTDLDHFPPCSTFKLSFSNDLIHHLLRCPIGGSLENHACWYIYRIYWKIIELDVIDCGCRIHSCSQTHNLVEPPF